MGDLGKGPTEPSSDLRHMASLCWQAFVALTAEGFSEDQALRIVAALLRPGGAS